MNISVKKVVASMGAAVLLAGSLTPTVSASGIDISEELIQEKNKKQTEDIYQYIDIYLNEQNTNTEPHISEQELQKKLNSLDNQSLNDVINYSISIHQKEQSAFRSTRSNITQSSLKVAWKSAAAIARQSGYPLSATLVENSVDGKNYSEIDGQFASAIKNTSVYSDLSGSGTNSFTKSDSSDLFYAIHKFSYNTKGSTLYINDTFDFALDTNYQSLFTSLVNNWAYLNQNMHVLTPINVSIGISQ